MLEQPNIIQTIAIIGGTGKEGKGLAYRWSKAGYRIIIGSRNMEKALAAATEIMELTDNSVEIVGMENKPAARLGDIVVLAVPYAVHGDMIKSIESDIRGKILIDVTVPLVPPRVTKVQLPPAGSAAQEAQIILGDTVQVVSAFQNISYEHLMTEAAVDCDVLVSSNSKEARAIVLQLVRAAGLTGWDAGPLANSVVAEGLTSILIGLNKQFGVQNAGIRITGLPNQK